MGLNYYQEQLEMLADKHKDSDYELNAEQIDKLIELKLISGNTHRLFDALVESDESYKIFKYLSECFHLEENGRVFEKIHASHKLSNFLISQLRNYWYELICEDFAEAQSDARWAERDYYGYNAAYLNRGFSNGYIIS